MKSDTIEYERPYSKSFIVDKDSIDGIAEYVREFIQKNNLTLIENHFVRHRTDREHRGLSYAEFSKIVNSRLNPITKISLDFQGRSTNQSDNEFEIWIQLTFNSQLPEVLLTVTTKGTNAEVAQGLLLVLEERVKETFQGIVARIIQAILRYTKTHSKLIFALILLAFTALFSNRMTLSEQTVSRLASQKEMIQREKSSEMGAKIDFLFQLQSQQFDRIYRNSSARAAENRSTELSSYNYLVVFLCATLLLICLSIAINSYPLGVFNWGDKAKGHSKNTWIRLGCWGVIFIELGVGMLSGELISALKAIFGHG